MRRQSAIFTNGTQHGFFTREGGGSAGIYAGLNCGVGSGDDAVIVRENRRIAMAGLGRQLEDLHTPYQVHSATAHIIDQHNPDICLEADALVTQKPGIVLGIVTADCVPVLLHDPVSNTIAALHAGWKGTLHGIVANTVEAMVSLGAERSSIRAAIGPCIAQQSYEVGPEMFDAFTRANPDNARFFVPSDRDGHFRFDLGGAVGDCLARAEITHTDRLNDDTYTQESLYFSHRRATHRGEPDYGRQLSAIVLEGDGSP